MKQILGLVLATVIVISAAPYALSLGTPSPPAGVSANDWIPVGDAAGFVIAHANSTPTVTNPSAGTVKGYFIVRRANSLRIPLKRITDSRSS
jgi:hypothetical protein